MICVGSGVACRSVSPIGLHRAMYPDYSLERARGAYFRTNYRFQRTERERVKQAKKEEKLRKRQERDAATPEPDAPESSSDDANAHTKK